MNLLNKAAILSAQDLAKELVEVPEWGGSVYVRAMTGAERDAFELSIQGQKLENIRARLCAMCMVDESGTRLFGDKEAKELGQKSAAALDRVFAIAQRLNGIGTKDVEALEKN
jgi:hypothetical protein